jgi:hypothetical protein
MRRGPKGNKRPADVIGNAVHIMRIAKPTWKDVPGTVLVVALVSFCLYWCVKHPDWQKPLGFGPEWQCTPNGGSGPDFCYKKLPAEPN